MRGVFAAISILLSSAAAAQDYRARPPEDEIIYFLLPDRFENGDPSNDRGGLKGDRLKTGFDPTSKGFYHGGDLKGLLSRLDYIQGLGATAIWVAPIFKNKPVQGAPGQESAGYHGYWVTDFTRVDPHFGTNADFKALVDAAHARGMKVYMDIIPNHTADVIYYAECEGAGGCPYRSIADYPYQRRGGVQGPAINAGFDGTNFDQLTDPSWAYTVRVPEAEKHVKVPAWLNDSIYYHNRGNSTFRGESMLTGEHTGLDDLFTENPRVRQGLIEIYGSWIDRFGVDGFRVDTARHVEPEFWQQFVPAMMERAKARGIPNFHIFGEVADPDPAALARHTRDDKLPAVLDFAFATAVDEIASGKVGTDKLAQLFAADVLYEGGRATARKLPTFISNHDFVARSATFIKTNAPQASADELLKRVELANVLLFTARGVPTIYSGDEQGFVGDGGDQDAREDMFPSLVASYNDNKLLGTNATTAQSNFDTSHPLYRLMARLADMRKRTAALRHGDTVFRTGDEKPGLLAFSRVLDGREVLVAVNTSTQSVEANVVVNTASASFTAPLGSCPAATSAPGSVRISLPPLGYAVCEAR